MSAINFPSSPSNGQTLVTNDAVYTYNSAKGYWDGVSTLTGIQLASISVGANAPASGDGGLAYNSASGVFTYTPPVSADPLPAQTGNTGKYLTTDGSTTSWATVSAGAGYEIGDGLELNSVTTQDWSTLPSPLTEINGIASEQYFGGIGLSASDTHIVIGTPGGSGAVTAFDVYSAETGAFLRSIEKIDPAALGDGGLGAFVSISGTKVIMGHPLAASGAGAAYIFEATTGALLHTLSAPIGGAATTGQAVAISPNYAAVFSLTSGYTSSRIGVYNVSTGALLHTIAQVTSGHGHGSLSITDQYLVAGEPLRDRDGQPTSDNSGAVSVYDTATGSLLHTIVEPTPSVSGDFGFSVSVHGNYIAIGGAPSTYGAVYVYSASTGSLLHTFQNPLPAETGTTYTKGFGKSVSVYGGYLLVGALDAPRPGITGSSGGRAYLYDLTNGSLIQTIYGTSDNDQLGDSVAMGPGIIAIGVPQYDSNGLNNNGKAVIYKTEATTNTYLQPDSTIATTSYVDTAITNLVDSSPAALNTLNELAAALGDDANFSTTVTNSIASKAPLASPTFTGVPVAPTATAGTNTTQLATTAFVTAATVAAAGDTLPAQTGNTGKYLTTDGSTTSWAEVAAGAGYEIGDGLELQGVTSYDWSTLPAPTASFIGTTIDGELGSSLAASSSYLAATVGAASSTFSVYNAQTGSFERSITKPGSGNTYSGKLDISGTKIIFGNSGSSGNAGAAAIFEATTGNQIHVLSTTGTAYAGVEVAISPTYAAVNSFSAGNVDSYVDIYSVSTGNKIYTISNPDIVPTGGAATFDDSFGMSISMSDSYLVVAAQQEEAANGTTNSGVVYVYDTPTGTLLHTLIPSSPVTNAYFGISTAVYGDYIAVGTNIGLNVLIYSASTGSLLRTISDPQPGSNKFGAGTGDSAVAIDGNYLLVGASNNNPSVELEVSGAAYLFDITNGNLLHTILATSRRQGLGTAVAAAPGVLAVASKYFDNGSSDSSADYGKIDLYKTTTSTINYLKPDSTIATTSSPTFTGVPVAPTATAGTNTTQIATTAFVTAATANAGGSSDELEFTANGAVTAGKLVVLDAAGTVSQVAASEAGLPQIPYTDLAAGTAGEHVLLWDDYNEELLYIANVANRYNIDITTQSVSKLSQSSWSFNPGSKPQALMIPNTGYFIARGVSPQDMAALILGKNFGGAVSIAASADISSVLQWRYKLSDIHIFPNGEAYLFGSEYISFSGGQPLLSAWKINYDTVANTISLGARQDSTINISAVDNYTFFLNIITDKNNNTFSIYYRGGALYVSPISEAGGAISWGAEKTISVTSSPQYEPWSNNPTSHEKVKYSAHTDRFYLPFKYAATHVGCWVFSLSADGTGILKNSILLSGMPGANEYEAVTIGVSQTTENVGFIINTRIGEAQNWGNHFGLINADGVYTPSEVYTGTGGGSAGNGYDNPYLSSVDIGGAVVFGMKRLDITSQRALTLHVARMTTTTNAQNWIGIASDTVSDGSAVNVHLSTGLSNEHTGLSVGSKYYAAADGGLTTTPSLGYGLVGEALSSTTLQIVSESDLSGYATLLNATLIGTPTAPTATAGNASTQIATTAFVAAATAAAAGGTLPAQTDNTGKYLTTDGSTTSWATVSSGDTLPTQTGNTGKYLTTDGSTTSWATVSAGATIYASVAELPLSGVPAGAQAFVSATNRLYLWNGTGWYNIALINTAPTITTSGDAEYILAQDGTATVVTLEANDPEGIPITWSYAVTTGSLGSTATVSQANNVFTITPSTDSADAGDFTLTFTASDGVNLATSASQFSLAFGINWGSTLNVTLAQNVYNVNGYIYAGLGWVTDTTDAYSIIGGTRETSPQDGDPASYGKVYIIDNNTGSIVREHIGTAKLTSGGVKVGISDNYYAIATALFNQDMVLRVYDIATGSLQYSTSLGTATDRVITMNDNYIMIASGYIGPRIYDTASGTQIAAPTAPSGVSSWGGQIVFEESRMAIRGELAAAGYQGRVDVFEMSAGFPYLYSILAPIAGGQFGKNTDKAVTVTGSHIIISNRTEFSNKGRVYIYDATDGSLLHTLVPPASPYSNYFGYSVEANDNYLAVGTPDHDAFGVGGYAHLYDLTTGGLVAALSTPGNYPSGKYPNFGSSVSISEHRLAVGAPGYMADGSTPVGAGFVYNLYDIL